MSAVSFSWRSLPLQEETAPSPFGLYSPTTLRRRPHRCRAETMLNDNAQLLMRAFPCAAAPFKSERSVSKELRRALLLRLFQS